MSNERKKMALAPGTEVASYRIIELLDSWGFFLSYLAEPKSGTQRLALLELVPEELVLRNESGRIEFRAEQNRESFHWARDRFLMEYRALAACSHPNLPEIREVFEANGTGYAAIRHEDGRNLRRWLQELGRAPTESELQAIFFPALDALETIHARGLLHLNLKPETIQLAGDGRPVLANFAGARQAIAEHTLTASAVTPGYSPPEQYDEQKAAGAWSDFYGLAAVMHRAIAGRPPPEATLRLKSDPYEKLSKRFSGQYSERFLIALDAALAPDPVARPQTAGEWLRMFGRRRKLSMLEAARSHPITAAAAAALAGVLATLLWPHPKPVDRVKEKDKKEQAQPPDKDEAARAESGKQDLAKKEEAEKSEAAKKEEEMKESARLEAEKKKSEENDPGKLEAAKQEAARKEAARLEAAKRETEMKEAERQAAAKKEAEKKEAGRLEAAKLEAAKKEAERLEAAKRDAERKEAARLEAARMEAEKKRDAEKSNASTPPPSSQVGYISPMFVGVWESKPDGAHETRRLEIKGNGSFALTGGESDSGLVNAYGGTIRFSSKPANRTVSGSYKMQSLGKMLIEADIAKGAWTRVQTSATPPSR